MKDEMINDETITITKTKTKDGNEDEEAYGNIILSILRSRS